MLVHQRVCAVHVRARSLDRYARLKRRTVLLSLCLFFFVPPQVLIAHARTCPGHHASRAHGEVCKSVKYLMLHIRDCCGRTPDGAACGFPWCTPCKFLIHHLVKCRQPQQCAICSPQDLPPALAKLRQLNQLRDSHAAPNPSPANA